MSKYQIQIPDIRLTPNMVLCNNLNLTLTQRQWLLVYKFRLEKPTVRKNQLAVHLIFK